MRERHRTILVAAVAVLGCLVLARAASAEELRVPSGRYPSLGAALGAAQPGDRIVITAAVEQVRRGRFSIRTRDLEIEAEDGFLFDRSTIRVHAGGVTLRGLAFSGTRIDVRGDDFTMEDCRFEGFVRKRRVGLTMRIRGDRATFSGNTADIPTSRNRAGMRLLRVKGDRARLVDNDVTIQGGAFDVRGNRTMCADNRISALAPENPRAARRANTSHPVFLKGEDNTLQNTVVEGALDGISTRGPRAVVDGCDVTSATLGIEILSDNGTVIGGSVRSFSGVFARGERVSVNGTEFRGASSGGDHGFKAVRVIGFEALVENVRVLTDLPFEHGLDVGGGAVTVRNCTVSGTKRRGIVTWDDATVSGCTVTGIGGIEVNGSFSLVEGNRLEGAGITLQSRGDHITVTGNEIANAHIGIHVSKDQSDASILNNVITGARGDGMLLVGRRFVVEDNVISADQDLTVKCIRVEREWDHAGLIAGNVCTLGAGVWLDLDGNLTTIQDNEVRRLSGPSEFAILLRGRGNTIRRNDLDAGDVPGGGVHVRGDENTILDQTITAPADTALSLNGVGNEATRVVVSLGATDGIRIEGSRNLVTACSATACTLSGLSNAGEATGVSGSRFEDNGLWDVETSHPFESFEDVIFGTMTGP